MFLGVVIYPPPHILADPRPLVRRSLTLLLLHRVLLRLALDDVPQLGHVVGHVLDLHQLHVVRSLVQLRRKQLDLLTGNGREEAEAQHPLDNPDSNNHKMLLPHLFPR